MPKEPSATNEPKNNQPVQPPSEGIGPLYHRVYTASFEADSEQVEAAWQLLCRDINAFSPQLIATFEKTKGRQDCLKVGDEFEVKLTAPWRAPVRVCESSDGHFCLETLDGHLEAGRIEFGVRRLGGRQYRFEIESVARSKDHLVNFFYDKVPIARFAQGEMWQKFCRRFVGCVRTGEPDEEAAAKDEIEVLTERRSESSGKWKRL